MLAIAKPQSKPVSSAVIYCRVSTDEQSKNFSLELQEQYCRDYCRKHGFTVKKVFIEKGESARTDNRPKFLESLVHCNKYQKLISHYLVYRFDRFSRDTLNYFAVKTRLAQEGILLISATQNSDGSPESELAESITVAVGKYESQVIGIRAKAGMTKAREAGHLTGPAPVGYLNTRDDNNRSVIIVDRERGSLIGKAFEMFAQGIYTKKEVVDHLNSLGYLSRLKHKPMTIEKLRYILKNRTYVGDIFVNEEKGYAPSAFPPLVTRDVFDSVQTLLSNKDPRSVKHYRINQDFPLRGTVKCSTCGKSLTGSWSSGKLKKKYPNYCCYRKNCRAVSIRKEELEREFVKLLERIVPTSEFLKFFKGLVLDQWNENQLIAREQMKAIVVRLEKLRQKKDKLIEMYIYEERIDSTVFETQNMKLIMQIDQLELELAEMKKLELDMDSLVNGALYSLKNAARMWINGDIHQRISLQNALFPQGLLFSMKAGIGTPLTPMGFNMLELINQPKCKVAENFESGDNLLCAGISGKSVNSGEISSRTMTAAHR